MSKSEKTEKPAAQVKPARKALKLKAKAEPAPHPPAEPMPDEGVQSVPNPNAAPSGALDAEGHRPVLERSRKVR